MKITTLQLRRIIKEEVSKLAEARGTSAPLLQLFDVSSLDELDDADLNLVVAAAAQARTELENRRNSMSVEERLKPISKRQAIMDSGILAGDASKLEKQGYKFYTDGGRVYAVSRTGSAWAQPMQYGKPLFGGLKPLGKNLDVSLLP